MGRSVRELFTNSYRDILAAGKKTEAEIAEIESELENLALIGRLALA
jgi:hypothetical protein